MSSRKHRDDPAVLGATEAPRRRGAPLAALAILCVLPAIGGCGDTPEPAVTAERLVLQHELDKLSEYLDVDFGRLLVEGDLLVVVREEVVGELLEAALPLELDVAGGYRVRLDEARVRFRTALALIELRGRVSAVAREGTFADVVVHAALEVAGIAGDPPVLQARPRVLGLEAREVAVVGLTPPAERLVEELARRRLGDLESALGVFELPVVLERSITLPGVDATGVRIPPTSLEVAAVVDRVLVADRRLWVSIDLDLSPASVLETGAGEARSAAGAEGGS